MSLAILKTDVAVRDLEAKLRDDPGQDNLKFACTRLRTLLDDDGDPEYSHPHDAAIAAYAWALRHDDRVRDAVCRALQDAMTDVSLRGLPRLWHARFVFEELQAGRLDNEAPYTVPADAAAHLAATLVGAMWRPEEAEEPA